MSVKRLAKGAERWLSRFTSRPEQRSNTFMVAPEQTVRSWMYLTLMTDLPVEAVGCVGWVAGGWGWGRGRLFWYMQKTGVGKQEMHNHHSGGFCMSYAQPAQNSTSCQLRCSR